MAITWGMGYFHPGGEVLDLNSLMVYTQLFYSHVTVSLAAVHCMCGNVKTLLQQSKFLPGHSVNLEGVVCSFAPEEASARSVSRLLIGHSATYRKSTELQPPFCRKQPQ